TMTTRTSTFRANLVRFVALPALALATAVSFAASPVGAAPQRECKPNGAHPGTGICVDPIPGSGQIPPGKPIDPGIGNGQPPAGGKPTPTPTPTPSPTPTPPKPCIQPFPSPCGPQGPTGQP